MDLDGQVIDVDSLPITDANRMALAFIRKLKGEGWLIRHIFEPASAGSSTQSDRIEVDISTIRLLKRKL